MFRRRLCLVVQRKKRQERVFERRWKLSERWVFALTNQKGVVQPAIIPCTKAEGRIKMERARKVLFLNLDFQPQKQKDMAMPGNQTIGIPALLTTSCSVLRGTAAWYCTGHTAWMASVPLNLANHPTHVVLDLDCTRSSGSRASIKRFQEYALYSGITTEFCCCNECFVCTNSEIQTCWESIIFRFLTTPPCSTRVYVLETGNVPILFPLSRMKNSGTTIGLDPKRRQNYMSSFWLVLFSSRTFHNGTHCVRFDESCVPAQIA